MRKLFCIVFMQVIVIYNISAQYPISGFYPPQPQPRVLNQKQNVITPLLMSFLNKRPVPEKIETVANAIQRTPPRTNGRKNKRHEMADFLKQSALQSLREAANACQICNKELPVERLPATNPMTVPINMASNMPRTVKIQY